MKYYSIHIFFDRKNSYSIPFKSNEDSNSEIAITEDAMDCDVITSEESDHVDYIEEITEREYYEMGGK